MFEKEYRKNEYRKLISAHAKIVEATWQITEFDWAETAEGFDFWAAIEEEMGELSSKIRVAIKARK